MLAEATQDSPSTTGSRDEQPTSTSVDSLLYELVDAAQTPGASWTDHHGPRNAARKLSGRSFAFAKQPLHFRILGMQTR